MLFGKYAVTYDQPKCGFADIHTHILPGIDDGAKDMAEAMALLRLAYNNGTKVVFLTSHYREQYKKCTQEDLQHTFFMLSQAAQQEMPDLELYLGSEIRYKQEAPEELQAGRILSMNNSRYCLLEFYPMSVRSQIFTAVSSVRNLGYFPIIAHVERNLCFLRDKTLADDVLRMGALLQLNADSVMNAHGRKVSGFCRQLLKDGKVHFIATDAHDCIKRMPILRECFQWVSRKYGRAYALALFCENARAIIEDREL